MENPQQESAPKRSVAHKALGAAPTLLVLLALAAVGWWGHQSGWKAPGFSSLRIGGTTAQQEDWCAEHNVPESKCIACNPALAGENPADWCKEHGVAESKCTICHPEILETGVAGDWCREHGVPESGCPLCHPEIARKGDLPPSDTDVVVTSAAATQPSPSTLPASGVKNPETCQKHALRVQFASVAAVAKVGVRLGKVVERPMLASLRVVGEVNYDRTRFARLSSRVPGTARHIAKELGAAVRAGEILAVIDSAEVGKAKAEYLQAHAAVEVSAANAKRLERSAEAGFRTEVERVQANAAAREAEIRLFNAKQALLNLGLPIPDGAPSPEAIARLGLPDPLLAALAGGVSSANLYPLVAPFDGVVVRLDVVEGMAVDSTRTLFEVADTRRMWVTMDAPPDDGRRVALGSQVIFRSDDARDEAVAGRVSWISTEVDEMTRTIKMRADVANEHGNLRAHTFGRAQIVTRTSPNAIAIPNEAVQWEGCCWVVFVRLNDEIFQTRKVRLGTKDAAYTEVLVGVLPGEIVVTSGSHVLKSEILKSNLGAGCCDDH